MILAGLALLIVDPAASGGVPLPGGVPVLTRHAVSNIPVPAGTPVRLKTVDTLDSRTVSQGQRFKLEVVDDVTVGSAVVIPRGTAAVGEVEAVSGKGMVGKAGKLVLQPLFIEIAGKRVYFVGTSSEKGKDSTGGVAAASILASGLFLIITGKSATVAPGSPLLGRVRTDIMLPPAQ